MSGCSNHGLQINTFIIVASKKAMNDGTTVLPKLFGLNSHPLGCDESAEVLVLPAVHTGQGIALFSMLKTSLLFTKHLQMQMFNHLPLLTRCILFREELDVKRSRFF